MNKWAALQLSDSRRPLLFEGEVEICLQDSTGLYDGEKKTNYNNGNLHLSTFRLMWIDPSFALQPIALNLSLIARVDDDSSRIKFNSSPKIRITFSDNTYIKLSFRNGGKDQFLSRLNTALKNKSWEQAIPQKKAKEEFTTSKAGITGIIRTAETRAKQTDESLQQAFTDLRALMDKARDMVTLAEKLNAQNAKANTDNKEESELRAAMMSIGIASPVTKESAGSLYHNQLSRQLYDWLAKPLQERFGGMISMPDLYCLFNRARGTELISPDDLYRACVLFEQLQLPLRLRKFESGVLVVQSLNNTDDAISKQVADIIKIHGPQSAFDLAREKNISIALATEQLETAERQGTVCRDETYGGVVYYLNFLANLQLVQHYIAQ